MNAVYWGLTALCIMKHKEALDAEEMIEYVMSCWDDDAGACVRLRCDAPACPSHHTPSLSASSNPATDTSSPTKGAFGAHPGHDAHILSTLSAIQILATHDALSRIDAPRTVDCTSSSSSSHLTLP
jgi:geranylgeranyl transferase type-2 subunit beta